MKFKMDNMVILAQIVAIFAIITFALIPHQKTKPKVLIWKLMSNVFYVIQYLLLGALSAAGTNFIDCLQAVIFYSYAKKNTKVPIFWWILYVIVIIIIGFFTYTNIFSVIPIILCIIVAFGVWQDNLRTNRIIAILIPLGFIIYNISVSAYIGACGNIFQFVLAVIAVYRFKDFKFLNKKEVKA